MERYGRVSDGRAQKRASRDCQGQAADVHGPRQGSESDSTSALEYGRRLRPRRAHSQVASSSSASPALSSASPAPSTGQSYVDESDKFAGGKKPRAGGERGCRCNRTKCLKQYCACFRKDVRCMFTCSCQDCYNDGNHEIERAQAIRLIRVNHPTAFKGTALELEDQKVYSTSGAVLKEIRGCRCKMSKCQKKYCECFGANLKCSANCVCTGCQNGNEEGGQGILPETLQALSKPTAAALSDSPDQDPSMRSGDSPWSDGDSTWSGGGARQAWQQPAMAGAQHSANAAFMEQGPFTHAPHPQHPGGMPGLQARPYAAGPQTRQELPHHMLGRGSRPPTDVVPPTLLEWEPKTRSELDAFLRVSVQQTKLEQQQRRQQLGPGHPLWHGQRPPLPYGHGMEQRRVRHQYGPYHGDAHTYLERQLAHQQHQQDQQQRRLAVGLDGPATMQQQRGDFPASMMGAAGLPSFTPMDMGGGMPPSPMLSVNAAPTMASLGGGMGGQGGAADVPPIEVMSVQDDFHFERHAFAEPQPPVPPHAATPSPVLHTTHSGRLSSSLWSSGGGGDSGSTIGGEGGGVLSGRALMSPFPQPSPRAGGSEMWSPQPQPSPKLESFDMPLSKLGSFEGALLESPGQQLHREQSSRSPPQGWPSPTAP